MSCYRKVVTVVGPDVVAPRDNPFAGQVWQSSRDAVVRLLFRVDTARLPDAACTGTCDSVLSLIGWSLWGVKLRPELCPEDENKHID